MVVDGLPGPAAGQSRTITGAQWAHIGGVAGYVLLDAPDLVAKRELRTGKLSDISGTVTGTTASDLRTGDYLTLILQHGQGAASSSYAYAVLPGSDQAATKQYAARPQARVIRNTSAVQAVRHERAGRFSAAFFEPGVASVVGVNAACIVAIEEGADGIAVHVSDPTQVLATIQVQLHARTSGFSQGNSRVSSEARDGLTVLTVDVSGLQGSTVTTVLKWQPPTASDLTGMTGRVAGKYVGGPTAASLHGKAGRFAGALNSQRISAALSALDAYQVELDTWLRQHPDADASVWELADLASRLVVHTSA
ncbi:hypothetical protein QF015_003314 [Paenarthrobacter sp. TE4293]|uniref:polysaccharide lyase beta-sandwich domain-containing protein n=1 Tax=Paenarthrobacter sp. TE4293 TaxID=3381695 RepID=UPI003D233BBD